MKCAYITGTNQVEVRDEQKPVPLKDELLVKIAYCGICTLEQRLYTGERTIYLPIIAGHEASATIVSVGPEVVSEHAIGDHVALDLANRCHICPQCLAGNTNLCENRFNKGQHVLGAFSEYMTVRPDQAHILPKELSLSTAALTEPLACAIRSLKKVDLQLGETLMVCGAGTMGMLHMKVALAMGARVIMCDIDKQRLQDALRMGCTVALDASGPDLVGQVQQLTRGRGVECCIITSSSKDAARLAFQVLAPAARVNVFTSYDDKPEFPIDMNTVHRREYQITGSESRTEVDFNQAVRVLSNKTVALEHLISKIFPLDSIGEAMAAALDKKTYRVLVRME
ncbi:MAG: alcohol dehydrogenase catalytic domain-containing protein [Sphaerochaeta sp.]|nr:alcohol dehydrogenase catalytic domain-containing protein [Sphaerochaeta sp.]